MLVLGGGVVGGKVTRLWVRTGEGRNAGLLVPYTRQLVCHRASRS